MSSSQSRRQFMFRSAAGLGGLLLIHCTDPVDDWDIDDFVEVGCPPIEVAKLDDLTEGVPLDFDYPVAGLECFLVKLGEPADQGIGPDGDIVAFSYLCTHMGCSLKERYNHEHKVLGPCHCHFTTFSLRKRGLVVVGQATQNLVQVQVHLEGDAIIATGLEGLIYGELANRCKDDEEQSA